MIPAATCRSVNHTLTHREANALELALSRSRSPHNAPHSPSYGKLEQVMYGQLARLSFRAARVWFQDRETSGGDGAGGGSTYVKEAPGVKLVMCGGAGRPGGH